MFSSDIFPNIFADIINKNMFNSIENLILTARWLNIIVGLLMFIFGNPLKMCIFTRSKFRNAASLRYLIDSSIAHLIILLVHHETIGRQND